VLIGGRLPADIVNNLSTRLSQKLHSHSVKAPAIAPVSRASLSDDAPAVGAAILPFSERLLPTRTALMKVIPG
jgi:predicted NBD/HSP70 family sugar kinase